METFYTLVDYNGNTVRIISEDFGGYEVKHVSLNNASLYKTRLIADGELNNINRIIKNDDFYNVDTGDVTLPLRVIGVKNIRQLFEV